MRRSLGLCPQYNTLFSQLTVDEHLYFYCRLKGKSFSETEASRLIDRLSLSHKRDTRAKLLSGGMKRKLCVAIALIGGSEVRVTSVPTISQVVMFDEPTAGMDPAARHDCWSLLQEMKRERTILLSTHYMEEADLLYVSHSVDDVTTVATGSPSWRAANCSATARRCT